MDFLQRSARYLKQKFTQVVDTCQKYALPVIGAGAGAASVSTPAHAVGPIDDLFAAVDITTLSTNVQTLLIAGVGLAVLFLGYRFVKKAANNF